MARRGRLFRFGVAAFAVVLALGWFVASAWSQQQPDAKIIEAWIKAGGTYGTMTAAGFVALSPPGESGALSGFTFYFKDPQGKLADLPVFEVPFGLKLGSSNEAVLKSIARQRQLKFLDLSNTVVTDAELKNLSGLQLEQLVIPKPAQTDLALKHYLAARKPYTKPNLTGSCETASRRCRRPTDPATVLNLDGWQITDAALKDVANLRGLENLNLAGTKVTDAGLKELAGLTELRYLNLGSTAVTDAGLRELGKLKQLQSLKLHQTKVTDAGLKELAGLTELGTLRLASTAVTDAGLRELGKLKQLQELSLNETKVTDEGLKALAGLTQLWILELRDTKVTGAGLKELSGLKIEHLLGPKELSQVRPTESSQGLGSSPTRCEGEACSGIELTFDGRCMGMTNKGQKAIQTEEMVHGGIGRGTLLPGKTSKMSSPMGCLGRLDEVGLYRATYNTAAAAEAAKQRSDSSQSQGKQCTWQISSEGVWGYAELIKPSGMDDATATIGVKTFGGYIDKLKIEYGAAGNEFSGTMRIVERLPPQPSQIRLPATMPLKVLVNGQEVARFRPPYAHEEQNLTDVFGPNLDKLKQAKSLTVAMILGDRDLSILSCPLLDMEATFAKVTSEAKDSRELLELKQKQRR